MTRHTLLLPVLPAAVAGVVLSASPRAEACGGCFHVPAPQQVTTVTGHRMAFAISQTQTTLWDQIQYSGSPSDFAWVLPVKPGAVVQVSHEAWFDALDAYTTPVIDGPTPQCGAGGGGPGFGCGNSNGTSAGTSGADDGGVGGTGVDVLSQAVVGPYQTVTLQSSNPTALSDWLAANHYEIPASVKPTIAAYVSAGFDFIALRLAPGQGVQAMQPVRVTTPGAGLTLPLRMVEAGAGARVGIILYVIGEGRYQAANFPNAVVNDDALRWTTGQSLSNYQTIATQLMAGASGRTWLTEFAQATTLDGPPSYVPQSDGCTPGESPEDGGTAGGGSLQATGSDFSSLYYAGCACVPDGSCETGLFDDGGQGSSSPCTACDVYDDIKVALTGLDPSSAWITRLRANLPSSALAAADLSLGAAPTQAEVSNLHTAAIYDDPTYNPCAGGGGSTNGGNSCSTDASRTASENWLVVGSLGAIAAALAKRRRRRGC